MSDAGQLPTQANGMESQYRFEALVALICSKLASARPQNIDGMVTQSLQEIGEAMGGNRVLFAQVNAQTGELLARAQYRSTEPPFPQRLSIGELNPWMWGKVMAGEVLNVHDTSALPDEAVVDRVYFQRINLCSYFAVPVVIDGTPRYMLAVGSVGRKVAWAEEAVPRLRVLAQVLASALMRCDAEEILRQNEQMFRAFVEKAPLPIMLAPAPDGKPLYFNPEFTRLFGYARDDVPEPAAWWPLAYPDPEYRAERMVGWERAKAAASNSDETREANEAEICAKDGRRVFSQIRLAMIESRMLIFFHDMTERRQAERALRLTQFAVDHNPGMIFRIDARGRFVYANQSACRGFGWSMAELLTRRIWDISGTLTEQIWPQRVATVREQGGVSLESVYRRKDGSTFPVEAHIHYLRFAGEESFFVFALDISARRAAQEAAHSQLQRVQALAAGLSRSEEQQRRELARLLHDEIGQNLFAVTTQLLSLKNRVPAEQETIGKILMQLDGIARDTRELTFELCPPELYQLGLSAALKRLADQFGKRHHIAVTLAGGGDGPTDLNARGLLYHAVRELLINVAKHAKASHVTVWIKQQGIATHVGVEDNGIGYNAEAVNEKRGFGLFYLRERIELLGGRLLVDAAPGAGCRVRIDLPAEEMKPE